MNRSLVEVSQQAMPIVAPEDQEPSSLAPSRPLYELQDRAPGFGMEQQTTHGAFPCANDESAAYFEQVAARTATPDYRAATNRTALLVGESALISALPYLSEETVILLDNNPRACAYMRHYVDSLREAPDIQTWHLAMAQRLNPDSEGRDGSKYRRQQTGFDLARQIRQWQRAGLRHSLDDPEAYWQSHLLAREKAIIPWHADLRSEPDMQRLAQALDEHDATITMANLTNAINWPNTRPGTSQPLALDQLPMTEYAPILTTSMYALPPEFRDEVLSQERPAGTTYLVGATGPFFGLANLYEQGGTGRIADRDERLGKAVFRRQYVESR